MKSHSGGIVPGDRKRHCMVYDRLTDYYRALDAGVDQPLRIDTAEDVYARAFENHDLQIRAFFEDKPIDRFFQAELYDTEKYFKLSKAWSMPLEHLSDVQVHRSSYPMNQDFATAEKSK